MKKLQGDAREILCGAEVPQAQQKGAHSNAQGQLPFGAVQLQSLMEVFGKMPGQNFSAQAETLIAPRQAFYEWSVFQKDSLVLSVRSIPQGNSNGLYKSVHRGCGYAHPD